MSIADFVGIAQALLALLMWLGLDFKALRHRMPSLASSRSKRIQLSIIGSILWSGYSLVEAKRSSYLVTDWLGRDERWKAYPKKKVEGRTFLQETVPLDGFEYVNCTFNQVTFLINATAPYEFAGNTVVNGPVHIKTENARIGAVVLFLKNAGSSAYGYSGRLAFCGNRAHLKYASAQARTLA